jgi:opacity protein-like surface antigen
MSMKRFAVVILLILLSATGRATAQAAESASAREVSVTAGGFFSVFNPGDGSDQFYDGGGSLLGMGAYVDARFTRWIQVEAEGRWLRFNGSGGEHMDHYLIGPRVPIHDFGRFQAYGKVLFGVGKMTFPDQFGYGSFTALAYGGGVDYKLSRKLTVRAADFEFQQWPKWLPGTALYPWGVSAGIGYRVF